MNCCLCINIAVGITVLLLVVLRFVLIAYAKRIPRFSDQKPHIIAPNDKEHQQYNSTKQWQSYTSKRDILSTNCKNAEVRMYKKNTNTYREKEIRKKNRLNFNTLTNVIGMDIDCQYADVEGSITFEAYLASILPYGFIPTVVPELKSITVGGAIVGVGIESSSFRYGLVHESMIECDILLSNGTVITCNKDQNSDLFSAIPNSLGSLGYILRARMRIRTHKNYVELRNIFCKNYDVLGHRICKESNTNESMDFIDGIAYWNGTGRIMIGTMIDNLPCNKQLTKFSIFHRYIENGSRSREKDDVLYLSISDYLWRWDTDMFWTIKNVGFLNNWLIRWYLSPYVMRSDVIRHIHNVIYGRDIVIQKPKQIKKGNQMFINDIIVPQVNVNKWMKFWFEQVLYIRDGDQPELPLWLCPTKGNEKDYSFVKVDNNMNVNFGYWSTVAWDKKDIKVCEFVEEYCDKYKALKLLYGTTMYSEDKFYELFDPENVYFDLKKKYDKDTKIRHFYDKCTQK